VYLSRDREDYRLSRRQLLGTLGATAGLDTWEPFSFFFRAPSEASELGLLWFQPYDTGEGGAYAGLDSVVLSALPPSEVPVPASGWLLLAALTWVLRRPYRPTTRHSMAAVGSGLPEE